MKLGEHSDIEQGTYYAVELEEMLHDMEYGPNQLPWRVYRKGIFIGLWVADCKSKRVAKILVEELTKKENEKYEENMWKSFKERVEQKKIRYRKKWGSK